MAGVPPVLELVVVQPVAVPLKFSLKSVVAVLEFEVALDDKPIELPLQIVEEEEAAVTEDGFGLTTNVFDAVAVPQLPPLVVSVKVTVPVWVEGGV